MAKLNGTTNSPETPDGYPVQWDGPYNFNGFYYSSTGLPYLAFPSATSLPGGLPRITGTAHDDVLAGTNGSDTLDGAEGDDTMAGGLGNDEYHVDATADVIRELAGGGTDTVHATASRYTLSAYVEALVFKGTGAFTGIGNAQANVITGGAGDDRLEGGGGDDSLSAGAGNDTMLGGAGNDGITATAGHDVFDGGTGIDTVYAMAARDSYMVRRAGADGLVFTSRADGQTLTVTNVEHFEMAGQVHTLAGFLAALPPDGNDSIGGTAGNDRLDGFDGIDTLAGGMGNDTYVVRNAGTKVVEVDGGGIDTAEVAYAGKAWQLAAFVENGTAVEGKLAISIDGNGLDNTLTGNAAANVLTGGAGNDVLDGGKGADVLAGGSATTCTTSTRQGTR